MLIEKSRRWRGVSRQRQRRGTGRTRGVAKRRIAAAADASGIGPADDLRRHGIRVEVDAPGVGDNLQDHLDICTLTRSRSGYHDRINELAAGWNWFVHRRGPGTSNVAEAGGFLRSALAPDERADVQFHFVPAQRPRPHASTARLHRTPALRPRSRGRLKLASASAGDKVLIHANYLSDAEGSTCAACAGAAPDARCWPRPPSIPGAARSVSRQPGAEPGRHRRLHPRQGRDHLPPDRHLPHGQRRCGRGRSAVACAWRRGTAGG